MWWQRRLHSALQPGGPTADTEVKGQLGQASSSQSHCKQPGLPVFPHCSISCLQLKCTQGALPTQCDHQSGNQDQEPKPGTTAMTLSGFCLMSSRTQTRKCCVWSQRNPSGESEEGRQKAKKNHSDELQSGLNCCQTWSWSQPHREAEPLFISGRLSNPDPRTKAGPAEFTKRKRGRGGGEEEDKRKRIRRCKP